MAEKKKNRALAIVRQERERVVEKIVQDMEKDGLHWLEPYLPALSPRNPVTGTVYKGGNRLHLGFVAYERGYEDSRWCTFNQIRDNGWHLRKGSKAAIIERWKEFVATEENKDTGESEVVGHYLRCIGYWNVYNAAEIEGMPAPVNLPVHEKDYTEKIADRLIASSRCPVDESARYFQMAAYAPLQDEIKISPRACFRSDESFTRVLLHEMTHSTGHASALGRTCSVDFQSPEYAIEELVAELGSLFTSVDLGIQSPELEGAFYDRHVLYLKSWIGALENDPDYLFKAAAQADKASSYLMERYEQVPSREPECDVRQQGPEQKVSLEAEAGAMRRASIVQNHPSAASHELQKAR